MGTKVHIRVIISFYDTSLQISGRPDQANTGLTEPDWSGNFYRTEPDFTEPDLIAYKFSNIPSFKVSETLNYEN